MINNKCGNHSAQDSKRLSDLECICNAYYDHGAPSYDQEQEIYDCEVSSCPESQLDFNYTLENTMVNWMEFCYYAHGKKGLFFFLGLDG